MPSGKPSKPPLISGLPCASRSIPSSSVARLACPATSSLEARRRRTPTRRPILQRRRGSEPLGFDADEAAQRSAREVHDLRVWARERGFVAVGAYPGHQVVAESAAGHAASDHERNAAEHPLLDHVVATRQGGADALDELLAIGHRANGSTTAGRRRTLLTWRSRRPAGRDRPARAGQRRTLIEGVYARSGRVRG